MNLEWADQVNIIFRNRKRFLTGDSCSHRNSNIIVIVDIIPFIWTKIFSVKVGFVKAQKIKVTPGKESRWILFHADGEKSSMRIQTFCCKKDSSTDLYSLQENGWINVWWNLHHWMLYYIFQFLQMKQTKSIIEILCL